MHDFAGARWQSYVQNMAVMLNSVRNGLRWEDIWLGT